MESEAKAAAMPGFEDSDDAPEPNAIEDLAAIVSTGIDHVLPTGKPFHMMGFSFGGIIGGFAAAIQGDRLLPHTFSGLGGMGLTRNSPEHFYNWREAKAGFQPGAQALIKRISSHPFL